MMSMLCVSVTPISCVLGFIYYILYIHYIYLLRFFSLLSLSFLFSLFLTLLPSLRATTTMKGTPAEILECLLDFDNAPQWDLLLKSSEALEYIDSQTAVCIIIYYFSYYL